MNVIRVLDITHVMDTLIHLT